jgi:hypothetical protein
VACTERRFNAHLVCGALDRLLCHYSKAEEILAEIEASSALSSETETVLAIRAQAHATLALAAATAIDPDRQREEWRDVAGVRYTDTLAML